MGDDNVFIEEDTNNDYSNEVQEETQTYAGDGVGISEKPTLQKIWDPEQLVVNLEMTWKGYEKKDDTWVANGMNAKARDEFISNAINSIRSVVNPTNMITKMDKEDLYFLLLEKNLEFLYAMLDEISVDEDDYESLGNQFDHVMETFVGIVMSGHGSKVLTQVYAGLHAPIEDNKENGGIMDSLVRELKKK